MNSEAGTAPVDASKWSEESLNSAVRFPTEYKDIEYTCWHCRKRTVFSAKDQKHAYEVKKRYFWQRRILCGACWEEANSIKARIKNCEKQWAESKQSLSQDQQFLTDWLGSLNELEVYVPYKPDTAKKNMLRRLIEKHA